MLIGRVPTRHSVTPSFGIWAAACVATSEPCSVRQSATSTSSNPPERERRRIRRHLVVRIPHFGQTLTDAGLMGLSNRLYLRGA
ncbi:hypothetical protein DAEQUDRAFT_497757 [Daedalea quercina L-15889]|uniref:Uncharacterized protein n=1 Tax=Daedalea quercina L-15889 TaxID=1314783 RepID=A0A165MLI3_9APHY|nr:hypothetical protein DAEQUDRAFT_497757 [Daedalea quercina L-15889]